MNWVTLILVLVFLVITFIIYKIVLLMIEIKNQNLNPPSLEQKDEEEIEEHFDPHQLDIEKIINQKIEEIQHRNNSSPVKKQPPINIHDLEIKTKPEIPVRNKIKNHSLITTEELDI